MLLEKLVSVRPSPTRSSRLGAYIKIGCQIAHKKRYISALCVTFHDKWCPDAATHHEL